MTGVYLYCPLLTEIASDNFYQVSHIAAKFQICDSYNYLIQRFFWFLYLAFENE